MGSALSGINSGVFIWRLYRFSLTLGAISPLRYGAMS